jgi:hypothetical protein
VDEVTGLPLFRGSFADPSAEKAQDKSDQVEFAAKVQPVPPATIPGLPIRAVVLEGLTVQPHAEMSGQAKWISWVVRAAGMRAVAAANGQKASRPAAAESAPKAA